MHIYDEIPNGIEFEDLPDIQTAYDKELELYADELELDHIDKSLEQLRNERETQM